VGYLGIHGMRLAWTAALGLWSFSVRADSDLNIMVQANALAWTSANVVRLEALFKNTQVVSDLVNQLLAPEDRDEEAPEKVGEFAVVDLNNDGNLELVCTVDATGRDFFTSVVVLSQSNGKTIQAHVSTNGYNLINLPSHLVDLNHDGMKEILVPRLLGPYAGADPVAAFTDVYTLLNGRLVQSDKQFREYYVDSKLPELKAQLARLRLERTARAEKSIAAAQTEIEAIERFLVE